MNVRQLTAMSNMAKQRIKLAHAELKQNDGKPQATAYAVKLMMLMEFIMIIDEAIEASK